LNKILSTKKIKNMRVCREISRWVNENVERPIEEWINRTERQCVEQPCNWWCLCCNKWFCFLVTLLVRIVTLIIVTITRLVTEIVCEIVGLGLDIIAGIVGLILSIPIIGGIIRMILNWLTEIIWRLISLPDLLVSLTGYMVPKKIYIKGIILNDNGTPFSTEEALLPSINFARTVLQRECNVRLIYTGTCVPKINTPTEAQTIDCGSSGFFADLLGIQGAHFEFVSSDCGFEDGHKRVIGLGSELFIFIIRDVQPDNIIGCSFASTHNYVTVEVGALGINVPDTVVHEIGHACDLTHADALNNLMFPNGDRTAHTLSTFQRAWLRSSKHCVIF
jgi:hypothetical protein